MGTANHELIFKVIQPTGNRGISINNCEELVTNVKLVLYATAVFWNRTEQAARMQGWSKLRGHNSNRMQKVVMNKFPAGPGSNEYVWIDAVYHQPSMAQPVYSEPPDGGWGWVVVLAGFLKNCLVFGIIRSLGVFFIQFIQYYEESSSRISWITSISVATQQFATAQQRPQGEHLLHCPLFCSPGFGWALVFAPTMATIARYFKRRRALATGLAFTGVGVASFFFSPLFQLLIDEYGWRGALQILSAMMLNLCVCAALLRPIMLREDLLIALGGHPNDGRKGAECWGKVTSAFDLTLFLHRGFMVYTFAVTLMTMGYFVPYVHLVAHGKNLGLSDYEAAFLLSVTAISDIVARLFSGWVADLKLIRAIHMLFLWSVLTGLSLLLIPLGQTYASLMGLGLFYGFCSGALPPLFFSTLPAIVGIGRILNATGLFLMCLSIGALFGPPLSGNVGYHLLD
uniref:monocarboxylate transporter 13-like n=1 Tax=Pristiophorus japonicus TaxID=55135 RepID=UPI00398F6014